MIGGYAPSTYLSRLQKDKEIDETRMDAFVATHLIDAGRLRVDDFEGMLLHRAEALLGLTADAMQRPTGRPDVAEVFGVEREGEVHDEAVA